MLKHIVVWTLKDSFSDEEKHSIKIRIKASAEALVHSINECKGAEVITDLLETSNADILMISSFENPQDLEAYRIHPKHQEVLDFIKPLLASRVAADYLEGSES